MLRGEFCYIIFTETQHVYVYGSTKAETKLKAKMTRRSWQELGITRVMIKQVK